MMKKGIRYVCRRKNGLSLMEERAIFAFNLLSTCLHASDDHFFDFHHEEDEQTESKRDHPNRSEIATVTSAVSTDGWGKWNI